VEDVLAIREQNLLVIVKWVKTNHTKFLISLPMNMGRESEPESLEYWMRSVAIFSHPVLLTLLIVQNVDLPFNVHSLLIALPSLS
jgi:hypothetical protein